MGTLQQLKTIPSGNAGLETRHVVAPPAGLTAEKHPEASIRGTGVAAAFLLTLVLFVPTVWSFVGTWNQGIMSHGWLIAGLVCWLVWRQRRDFLLGEGGDPLLLIALAGISMFWLLATVARIQVFHQLALVLVLATWALVVSGRRNARLVALLTATFILAVPIWGALSPVLQRLTTIMSGGMVKLVGIPAVIQGDLIQIPAGLFHVADGCAGTGFLVSALAVGALYAHLMMRNWVAQLAVLGVAAGMALVANWLRVAGLIVVGHVTEMQSGLIQNHYAFGWIIFTIGLVPFFMLARQIEKRLDRGEPPSGPAETVDRAQYRRVLQRAVVAGLVAATGPVLYYGVSAMPSASAGVPTLAALAGGGTWTADDAGHTRPYSWQPEYQGATSHETPVFTDGTARVYADRFLFQRQTQGAKLIGFPNRLADPDVVLDDRLVGPVDPAGRRWVRQAVIVTPEGGVLTWYWYRVGGMEAASGVRAKLLEVPAFFTRRRSAEFIALSAPCGPDDCASAFNTLAAFTGARVQPPAEPTPQ